MKKLLSSLLALTLVLSLTVLPASALSLEDAKGLLAANYVDEIPPEILELDDLDAILEALGDPYTFYMTGEQYEAFDRFINGQTVVGIGATVENAFDNGGYRIMSILPDSPALEAGIQPGDILTAADGVPMSPEVSPQVHILGEEGTPLSITVDRNGQTLEFNLIRRAVLIPIVNYEEAGSAGYIECLSFGDSTPDTIREAIEAMDDHAEVWIMDLRANPGGNSDVTAFSASYFTGGGIMLYFRDGSGRHRYIYTPSNFPDLTDKPVIVLTSEHSASGSELFAGDIRSYGAGIALGQRTLGKGTAQIVLEESNCKYMVDGEAMKITAYRFFSPDGATNHIMGVLPTLLISPENTMAAALLLSAGWSDFPENHLRIDLVGQTFVVNLFEAMEKENIAAFTELLEALPPSAALFYGDGKPDAEGNEWHSVTLAGLVEQLGLKNFTPRTFSDTAGSPYAREIDTLATYLILNGAAGTFQPGGSITRAQFAAMVASALDLPEGRSGKFSDVNPDSPYADSINAMTDLGFLSGRGNGAFGPEDVITVQEAVTVLARVAAWSSMDGFALDRSGLPVEELLEYYAWPEWARVSARVLTRLEALPEGLDPAAGLTREQAAAMLCRLMENIHLIWD